MKIIELLIAAGPTSAPAQDTAPSWFTALENPIWIFGAVILISFMFMGKSKQKQEEKQAGRCSSN